MKRHAMSEEKIAEPNEINRDLENKVRDRTLEIQQKHDQFVELNDRLEQPTSDQH